MSTANPIRVLVVGPAPEGPASRGGMASVIRLMVDNPDPRFTVTAVPTFVDTGVVDRLRTGIRGMLTATAAIAFNRTDVVHVHLSHGGSVVRKAVPLLAARICGVPTIVHGHSFNFAAWYTPLPASVRRLVRWALRADRWLVLGRGLADEYRRCLRLDAATVQVLHNPVVLPETPRRPPSATRRLTVLTLGRLGQRKGTYDLLSAMESLPAQTRSRVHLRLAGDGDVEQVRAQVVARGLGDTVDVPGWLAPHERDEALRHADIFVLPSYDEGLPMALLEAMAHGIVPITTPVGGIPEAVTDGVHGLLVPPGDPIALGLALRRLVENDALRDTLSRQARVQAATFAVEGWREKLAEVWSSVTAHKLV
ncbi:glycosyltransferase family 4 protein [Mycolicibacterium goodii]|uniref:glycosyltransferase family 4 protein n=1 Tax=Mycolicibacterium goodii TaxID=134601 RepID=UPI001BDBE4A7|nr:glycosyltransferase family 4 protein [Mycolicibacterium goodii]MBU8808616.1 glycosyltransferase family 4 protein [Mycolicibacterium goodii]